MSLSFLLRLEYSRTNLKDRHSKYIPKPATQSNNLRDYFAKIKTKVFYLLV